jgi:hypothetical protein
MARDPETRRLNLANSPDLNITWKSTDLIATWQCCEGSSHTLAEPNSAMQRNGVKRRRNVAAQKVNRTESAEANDVSLNNSRRGIDQEPAYGQQERANQHRDRLADLPAKCCFTDLAAKEMKMAVFRHWNDVLIFISFTPESVTEHFAQIRPIWAGCPRMTFQTSIIECPVSH